MKYAINMYFGKVVCLVYEEEYFIIKQLLCQAVFEMLVNYCADKNAFKFTQNSQINVNKIMCNFHPWFVQSRLVFREFVQCTNTLCIKQQYKRNEKQTFLWSNRNISQRTKLPEAGSSQRSVHVGSCWQQKVCLNIFNNKKSQRTYTSFKIKHVRQRRQVSNDVNMIYYAAYVL